MKPVLFSFELPVIGEVILPAYFSLLTVGFALGLLLTWRDAKRLDIDADRIVDFNLYIIIFGILGARLLHVIADGHFMEYVNICIAPEQVPAVGNVPASCTADAQCAPYFLCNVATGHCHPPRDCLLALKIWRGGLTYYGGFLGAVAFSIYYLRKHCLPIWRVGDLVGYAAPLGLFWGRMGCFFNGCCFGTVTESSLGVVFPRGGAAWHHQVEAHLVSMLASAPHPVHPTQLYLALLNLAIFAICYGIIRPRKRFDGQVFWCFVILYALARSAVEVVRDDDRGVIAGVLSTSQLISLGCLIVAITMLWRLSRARVAALATEAEEKKATAEVTTAEETEAATHRDTENSRERSS